MPHDPALPGSIPGTALSLLILLCPRTQTPACDDARSKNSDICILHALWTSHILWCHTVISLAHGCQVEQFGHITRTVVGASHPVIGRTAVTLHLRVLGRRSRECYTCCCGLPAPRKWHKMSAWPAGIAPACWWLTGMIQYKASSDWLHALHYGRDTYGQSTGINTQQLDTGD